MRVISMKAIIGAAALLASASPITLSASALRAGDPGTFVRLNDACTQATECISEPSHICSGFHGDHEDYACLKNCGK